MTFGSRNVQAATKTADLLTYTQPFQNTTTTLSGQSVSMSTYFIKMDYWKVKQATLNLSFQISQLSDRQTSDLTVAVNGVKFYSFRPSKKTGLQTKSVTIPLRLLQGQNQITLSGQVLNQAGKQDYRVAQTPANWLTVDSRSTVNFAYQLMSPTENVDSFYDHFSGPDTIANQNSVIRVPEQATNAELTASMYALTGESRVITTENQQIPVTPFSTKSGQDADYQLIIAKYDHLPAQFKRQVSSQAVSKSAQIQRYDAGQKHYLIVTATSDKLLEKAARFVANQELMTETKYPSETVTAKTRTFTSELHYNGHYQLTSSADKIVGAGHQERSYFVNLPIDRNNADGSTVTLKLRYAKNLNFKNSLATVYVNDTAIGSKRLTAKRANGDSLTVHLPKGMALGNSFTVRVAFDLPMSTSTTANNSQTPWASVESDSYANIKSATGNTLLFSNYPSLFLKNQTYDHLAVMRPKTLTTTDYQTLTNIFNLIGNYAKQNTGSIEFYTKTPSKKVLKNANVIAFGTPKQTQLIRHLNSQLYFQYNSSETGFVSNEKLSLEARYAQTVGTAQLLRSPYNSKRGLLVVTGADSNATYLASTQINYQRNIQQYTGDTIVVDPDNNQYGYRFKKDKWIDAQLNVDQTLQQHRQLLIYLAIAGGIMLLILVTIGFLWHKHGGPRRRQQHEK